MDQTENTDSSTTTPTTENACQNLLQTIEDKLNLRADTSSGLPLSESLPAEIVRRVNALRNLQVEYHEIEASFFDEVHALECRYISKYQAIYEKRLNIIKGTYEPTDAEAKCSFDENEETTTTTTTTEEKTKEEEKAVGIPEFWLQVLKNSDVIFELIKEQDEPILKHLVDIRVTMQNEADRKGFTIEFEFTPNEYFTNNVLTKSYELRTKPDPNDPLSFEGPEIIKSEGCEVQWNKGKNATVKLIKKKQKHKNRGTIRVVTKEVQTESFFNFFSPPTVPEDADFHADDSDEMRMLSADFEIGHMLRDSIVPKAVLYFTGEIGNEDDGEYDEDDEDDEDDDDDDDDDDDQANNEDKGHHHGSSGAGAGGKHGPSGGKSRGSGAGSAVHALSGGQPPPDCKQQ